MQNAEKMCIFPTHFGKNDPKDTGYIYLCKIKNYKGNSFYKIGFSRNLEKRMSLLYHEHCNVPKSVILLAYGETSTMRSTEFHMHETFWNHHYSFVYESDIPKWSDEYFRFSYNEICLVIEELKKCCHNVKHTVTISDWIELPQCRCLPYHIEDLGYWETRELKCRCRSKCIGGDCTSHELCKNDIKNAHCD